jgi:hypothetical protein
MKEQLVVGFVSPSLLGRDNEVDRSANRGNRPGYEVVICIADDGEQVARARTLKRGSDLGMWLDPPQDRQKYLLVVRGRRMADVGERLV